MSGRTNRGFAVWPVMGRRAQPVQPRAATAPPLRNARLCEKAIAGDAIVPNYAVEYAIKARRPTAAAAACIAAARCAACAPFVDDL